jgi:hypothetical protein
MGSQRVLLGNSSSAQRCRLRAKLARRPLTFLVAPRMRATDRTHRSVRTTFARPSSMSPTPLARNAFPRQNAGLRFRSNRPATDFAVLPPRIGFQRSFALRPHTLGRARPVGRSARSSRSGTMGHTLSVDFCHRYGSRAPPRTRRTPQNLTDGCPPVQQSRRLGLSTWASNCGWQHRELVQPAEMSRARGLRPSATRLVFGTRHRDRSRERLRPNPIGSDTSCRCACRDADWRNPRPWRNPR